MCIRDSKKASRIIRERTGDFRDPQQTPALIAWLVRTADDFVRVLLTHRP